MKTLICISIAMIAFILWMYHVIENAPVLEPDTFMLGKKVDFSINGITVTGTVVNHEDDIIIISHGNQLYTRMDFECKYHQI